MARSRRRDAREAAKRTVRSLDRSGSSPRSRGKPRLRRSAGPHGYEHINVAIRRPTRRARVPVAPNGNRPVVLTPTRVNNIGSAPAAVDCFRRLAEAHGCGCVLPVLPQSRPTPGEPGPADPGGTRFYVLGQAEFAHRQRPASSWRHIKQQQKATTTDRLGL